MKKIRCAIYTRKSSEEGLEQGFNSLDAQREACAAYVASQASEGWSLLPQMYDDGGLSGGSLERPALQRLLADIANGKINIVVVYKVDRLTRSLLDFTKLVEAFDVAGTSFVSITQSFNTTTSMGRLTLNMLLSFAQFEREVTAERIRDKIAASKAKGMWMGGTPPLGYKPDGRRLAIVDEHAALIRYLFQRYSELGNVRLLSDELSQHGITVPQRTSMKGRSMGGGAFSRGQIYKILSNPVYVGEISHKGATYPGKHKPIIASAVWQQVQTMLKDNRQSEQRSKTTKSCSPLAGLAVDHEGLPLVASHACKGKVRYRYYVSKALQHGLASKEQGIRIPALVLEKAAAEALARLFDQPLNLAETVGLNIEPHQIERTASNCRVIAQQLWKRDLASFRSLVSKVRIGPDDIHIELDKGAISSALGLPFIGDAASPIAITIDARLKRSGRAMRLVQYDGKRTGPVEPQAHMVKLLRTARSWWQKMCDSHLSVTELAKAECVTPSWLSRDLRLNFLAPEIVEAILEGRTPASLDAKALLALHDLPVDWAGQKHKLNLA